MSVASCTACDAAAAADEYGGYDCWDQVRMDQVETDRPARWMDRGMREYSY